MWWSWGFHNSTCESIVNSLKAVYLGDVYDRKQKIAVYLFSVNNIATVDTIFGRIQRRLLPGMKQRL